MKPAYIISYIYAHVCTCKHQYMKPAYINSHHIIHICTCMHMQAPIHEASIHQLTSYHTYMHMYAHASTIYTYIYTYDMKPAYINSHHIIHICTCMHMQAPIHEASIHQLTSYHTYMHMYAHASTNT